MTFKLSLSLFLMLVVSRANCALISMIEVEKVEYVNGRQQTFFQPTIFHGKPEECNTDKFLSFASSGYMCLDAGTKLLIDRKQYHSGREEFFFNVSYDSSGYTHKERFEKIDRFLQATTVCFLYGYFSPDWTLKKLRPNFYVNFISEELKLNEVLSFSIRLDSYFDVTATANLGKLEESSAGPQSIQKAMDEKVKMERICSGILLNDSFSFKFRKQSFKTQPKGLLKITFIDENARKVRKENITEVETLIDPTLVCSGKTFQLTIPEHKFKIGNKLNLRV